MPIVNEIEMARRVKGSGTALGGRRYFCEFCEKVRCRPLPFFLVQDRQNAAVQFGSESTRAETGTC